MTDCRSGVVLIALLVLGADADAQSREATLHELEMERLMDQASQVFEKHDLPIEKISADFHYRCMRAVGDPSFCDCLVEKRPYILRFEHYIRITSRTKAELSYETLSDDSKVVVDKVHNLRDECVRK